MLNWYVLLTKGIIVLWKKENEVLVSLLVKFYAMALYDDVCTCILTMLKCLIEASNGNSNLIIVLGKVQLCLVYSCATTYIYVCTLMRTHPGFLKFSCD